MRAEGCGEVSFAVRECGGEFSPQAFLVLLSRQKNARPAGHTEPFKRKSGLATGRREGLPLSLAILDSSPDKGRLIARILPPSATVPPPLGKEGFPGLPVVGDIHECSAELYDKPYQCKKHRQMAVFLIIYRIIISILYRLELLFNLFPAAHVLAEDFRNRD